MDKNTRGNKKKTKSNTKNVLSVFIFVFLFIFSLPIRRSMFTYNKYVDHVELGFLMMIVLLPCVEVCSDLKKIHRKYFRYLLFKRSLKTRKHG